MVVGGSENQGEGYADYLTSPVHRMVTSPLVASDGYRTRRIRLGRVGYVGYVRYVYVP